MPTNPPPQSLLEFCSTVLDKTGEVSYAELQSLPLDRLADPAVMAAIAERIEIMHVQLRAVIWNTILIIGHMGGGEDFGESAEEFEAKIRRFERTLLAVDLDSEEDDTFAKFRASYDRELGREPAHYLEKVLRDTMIFVHSLTQNLLMLSRKDWPLSEEEMS